VSTARKIYQESRIEGHPSQYFVTALLVAYLQATYPNAWRMNGMEILLRHVRNLDAR
jgi:hypothetical protein